MKYRILLNFMFLFTSIHAQKETELIVIRNHYGPQKLFNQISNIDSITLLRSPFISAQDELSSVPNVNVQTRGVLGAQSDISIRGGSFEQTAIYYNGIRINNPQTGHNQSIVPIGFQNMENIQIVKSGSSKFFGGNAFAGAIFIEPAKPTQSGLNGQVAFGSFNSTFASLNYSVVKKNQHHVFNGTFLNSNGYRINTDQRAYQYTQEHHLMFGKEKRWDAYALFSFNSRAFGANGFYSLRFPNQYEEIQSYFYHAGVTNKQIKIDAYWNQVNDYYILKREQPSFYKNRHFTDARGLMMSFKKSLLDGLILTAQGEVRNEKTNSSNLGNRDRTILNANAYLDWQATKALRINAGGNINYINPFDPFLTGGINMAYQATKQHIFKTGFNTAYRIPTFTELYYNSFTDSGTATLNPEMGKNLEIAYEFSHDKVKVELNLFKRWCNNQIDWIKPSANASFYQSKNISMVQTFGIEAALMLPLKKYLHTEILEQLFVSYVNNQIGIDSLALARYSFNYLKNQVISKLYLNYTSLIKHSIVMRYEERSNLNYHYILLDTRIEFCPKQAPYSFYVNLNNITDVVYENFPGVPLPGFNCMAGIKFNLK